ncbi:16S rRNA (adenine(1518)-N(6)/adenine(1519)-N(6))-dimethyltransferase RsmA [Eubacteriales bacterium OttesenSCG-928-N13]|nr:16S rRNA (adenine(1518)-N(6)/adenine(1519)-N(6))-dimethyltransferase RsmA [Eubacteriales bacterium OttesenSCG-928-N13]
MSSALTARMALAKHGFEFTHSLGQNFLLDDGFIEQIVDAAGVGQGDRVLEIGAGAGVLTAGLCARGAKVLAIEIDRSLAPVLDEVLSPYLVQDKLLEPAEEVLAPHLVQEDNAALADGQVRICYQDVMKADLPKLTRDAFGEGERFDVVANLPYYITADVLLMLVKTGLPIDSITVMVQQEAAERIMSHPGEKSWCALAAMVQYFGQPSVLFQVPPEAFTPRPHVMSCLLRIDLHREKPAQAQDDRLLLRLITAAFAMRRKTLSNNLTAAFPIHREQAQQLIESCGLDPKVRGEALTLAQLAALSDAISTMN